MMRLVFVNHAHPDTPHVSGMRVGNFAREMANRGHQVVVLTSPVEGSAMFGPERNDIGQSLTSHDWTRPLVVAVPPGRRWALEQIRHGTLPSALRRALTLSQFVAHGGVFADWHRAAIPAMNRLADAFKPDLIWGTFGNTTNLAIAQQIARRVGCPWVMDIKDSWTVFVPRILRRPLAWRFRDAAVRTGNSYFHQEIAQQWFARIPTTVIYSGVADEFFDSTECVSGSGRYQLLLVGSVYDGVRLRSYLKAVRTWLESISETERQSVTFAYAGSDSGHVHRALKDISLPCQLHIMEQRDISDFALVARASFANSYLTASFTFHHKLLELLACGRPLICYPSERTESKMLASHSTTAFASCSSEGELRDALAAAWAIRRQPCAVGDPPPWRWGDFAVDLEKCFQNCLRERAH